MSDKPKIINAPIFVGIDPGVIAGTITILSESGEILSNSRINPGEFLQVAIKYRVWHVFMESQWGRGKDSPKRIGVLMMNYGHIMGVFDAWKAIFVKYDMHLHQVTPQKWQGLLHRGISRQYGAKKRSDMAFARSFPGKTLHKYAIDSALIAEYGRQITPKK